MNESELHTHTNSHLVRLGLNKTNIYSKEMKKRKEKQAKEIRERERKQMRCFFFSSSSFILYIYLFVKEFVYLCVHII